MTLQISWHNTMHYLVLSKLEYPTAVSLKIRGLTVHENKILTEKFTKENIKFSNTDKNYMEIDLAGVEMLNILAREFGYKVVGQAMAMELSSLGGRSFQIEKVTWTLEQQSCPYKGY